MTEAKAYWVYVYGISNPPQLPEFHIPTVCIMRKTTEVIKLGMCTLLPNLKDANAPYWVKHNTDVIVTPYAYLHVDGDSLTPGLLAKIREEFNSAAFDSVISVKQNTIVILP